VTDPITPILNKLVLLINEPLFLLMLLIIIVMGVVIWVMYRRERELQAKLEKAWEGRLADAQKGTPIFEHVADVLGTLASQARSVREEGPPLLDRINTLVRVLERSQQGRR
jgi:hypothetical protein